MLKVTVVVPVYNPGASLDECVESVLDQSLSAEDYEVVLVDDGSTDDAPGRLDEVAAEYRHVRVLHQANSGWTGKPRNVGVEQACGEYVQFVHQDDRIGHEALERMYAIASRNAADIVLGKVGGTMATTSTVFRQNVERCTIDDAPLIECVNPHQMFRRAFLIENGISFSEAGGNLGDQLFMVRAYLQAKTVSVVGDYACYYWNRREDGANSGRGLASSLRTYYDDLRVVLDTVDAATQPGELRDRIERRFFRVEMMTRLREPRLLRYSDAYREEGYKLVRELAQDRFTASDGRFTSSGVVTGLPPLMRLRATLLERDRLDGLMELARRCENVRGFAAVDQLGWNDSALCADVRAGLQHADGTPVIVVERDGRYELDPVLVAGLPTIEACDVGDPRAHAEAEVRVHHREDDQWWFAPAELRPSLVPVGSAQVGSGQEARYQVMVSGTASFDPRTLAGGGPLEPGRYDVWVSVRTLGLGRPVRLTVDSGPRWDEALVPAVVGDPARLVVPHRTMPLGQLVLEVDERNQTLAGELAARGLGPLLARGSQLHLSVPVQAAPGTGARQVEVVVGRAGSARTLPGRIQPAHEAVLAFGDVTSLPAGRHPLSLRTDPSGRQPAVPIGTAVVQGGRIVDVRGIGHRAIPRRVVARVAGAPWLHRQAALVLAALPDVTAERLRQVARRVAQWSQP